MDEKYLNNFLLRRATNLNVLSIWYFYMRVLPCCISWVSDVRNVHIVLVYDALVLKGRAYMDGMIPTRGGDDANEEKH